ncbi:hypothetical protein, partial [Mesorhizobium sp. M1A.F.Ca.ET.072.01.1.1]|uniref:hypothetical protein n=1 Tax=Mesorhizobium sp. M1A.F.Ca.ET.072.01.1.1 TaxID=2496753 RepID=UPI001AECE882
STGAYQIRSELVVANGFDIWRETEHPVVLRRPRMLNRSFPQHFRVEFCNGQDAELGSRSKAG